ncbi:MAG TPA: 2OG-Fe(II) oxygenase [Thermoanaerobaculia bacterium]
MTDGPFRGPYVVVDDFMPSAVALEMRAAAETHLGNPYRHSLKTHAHWDYWYVPGLYTYLRTDPENVLGARLMGMFRSRLGEWAAERLGHVPVGGCYLSLYVNGCRQGQHNDAANGQFGYVYSLTKDDRRTIGGETLIWNEENYFESRMHQPAWGPAFYQSIPPRFNRLLVFDDRMPHAVQLVEGGMDPIEARLVIHGHIQEAGPLISGPLPREAVIAAADELVRGFASELSRSALVYRGPATIRFTVRSEGTVAAAEVIMDRVKRSSGQGPPAAEMLTRLVEKVIQLRFEHATEDTRVILPFAF